MKRGNNDDNEDEEEEEEKDLTGIRHELKSITENESTLLPPIEERVSCEFSGIRSGEDEEDDKDV